MARHNHPTRNIKGKLTDRYDMDVCWLPSKPHIKAIVVHPLKVIYRNVEAYPWAQETKEIHNANDALLRLIEAQRWYAQ